jgi:hypothetical protein
MDSQTQAVKGRPRIYFTPESVSEARRHAAIKCYNKKHEIDPLIWEKNRIDIQLRHDIKKIKRYVKSQIENNEITELLQMATTV